MSEYSVSVTEKIHEKLKRIKKNNYGVTIGGLSVLILDSIIYDDNKVQKFIDVFERKGIQHFGARRLAEFENY